MISVTRKLVVRVASAISRLATSHVGRSRPAIGGLLGVAVVVGAAGRPIDRNTSARLRRSNAKWLTGAGAAGRVEHDAGPLGGRARAGAQRHPHPAVVDADDLDRAPRRGRRVHVPSGSVGTSISSTGSAPAVRSSIVPCGDDAAAVDDDGPLAQVLDEVELVRREQHGRAAAGLADEHLRQGVDGDGVEAGERLVEDRARRAGGAAR